MSVPTTLQGTHDGCGGTVVFRPATHRRELLAGGTVTLRAACRSCGETLSVQWALPAQPAAAAWQAPEREPVPAERHADQSLPMAAGGEGWHAAEQPAPSMQPRQEARPQPEQAPMRAPLEPRPVTDLGDWRLRTAGAPFGSRLEDRAPIEPQVTAAPAASAPPAPPTPAAPASDPAMDAYLSRFSSRVASARENLQRVSAELPSALAPAEGDSSFRAPRLSARTTERGLPPSPLSATPAALRPSAAPALTPEPPTPQPAAPAPIAAPSFAVSAAQDAIATAVASPSFHDDVSAPVAAAPALVQPAPLVQPEPLVQAEPIVQPEPVMEPEPSAQPQPLAQPEPVAELEPVAQPEPVLVPVAAPSAPAAPASIAAPGPIAPTDDDVFPPAPAQATMSPAAPEAVAAPADAAPDAAANVWSELPVASPAAAAASTPAVPAAPAAAATASVATEDLAPVAAQASFADAFGEATTSVPAMAGAAAPAAFPTNATSPEAAGAQLDEPDVSVAFEANRGFDWDGADEVDASRPRRARRLQIGRRKAVEEQPVDVTAGPEVVFEPSAWDDDEAPRGGSPVTLVHVVAIVVLAVFAGLAGSKIMANRDVASSAMEPAAVTDPAAIAPAEVTPPAAAQPAAGAKRPAAKRGAAPRAKARPKRPAGEQIPKITTTPTPGTAVADQPAGGLAGAAAGAAGTSTAPATSDDPSAQVSAAAADTAVVTASASESSTNPFARPE